MFRIKIAMVVIGAMLVFWGFQEFRVSSGTSSEPQQVELTDLEAGEIPSNTHLMIGSHYAIYGGSMYEFEQDSHASTRPTSSSKVTECCYPIISESHPFMLAIENEDEEFEFDEFAVLVKTKRFKSYGEIPDGILPERHVEGLVVNTIDSLDSEEKGLIAQNFPRVDLDKVLILEEGRQPWSSLASLGLMLGGLVLSGVGVVSFFFGSRQS